MMARNDNISETKTEEILQVILKKGVSVEGLLAGRIKRKHIQTLLLKIFESLANSLTLRDIFLFFLGSRFTKTPDVDQREFLELDRLIYQIIPPEFKGVELPPLSPFGLNSVLTGISQKIVVSALKNLEAQADVTTALALECARIRKPILNTKKVLQETNLCSSQRVVRGQIFDDIPGFTPHFRVFGACTAGRKQGSLFGTRNLVKHVSIYLDLLGKLRSRYCFKNVIVDVSDIRVLEKLIELGLVDREVIRRNTQEVGFSLKKEFGVPIPETIDSIKSLAPSLIKKYGLGKPIHFLQQIERDALSSLREKYPVHFRFDLLRVAGIGYYRNLCFKITAENCYGQRFPLSDGGIVDWLEKLLMDKREQLFISGLGTELFCRNFRFKKVP